MRTSSLSRIILLCLVLSGCAGITQPSPMADGDAAMEAAQFRAAIGHYSRAIDSGVLDVTGLVEAHLKRGTAYHNDALLNTMDDTDLIEALADASRARVLAPGLSNAIDMQATLSNIIDLQATMFQSLGAYPEALALFQATYPLDKPAPYWSLIGIGATYRMMGEYETALRYYNHVFDIPDSQRGMPIYYHRGVTFFEAGRYREAIDSLTAGLRQQRDYTFAYMYRACAYTRIGDYSRALEDYDLAIASWRGEQRQYGHTTNWQLYRDRLVAERTAVSDQAKSVMPAIAVTNLCEFPSYARRRERSSLLPVRLGMPNIVDFETLIRQ